MPAPKTQEIAVLVASDGGPTTWTPSRARKAERKKIAAVVVAPGLAVHGHVYMRGSLVHIDQTVFSVTHTRSGIAVRHWVESIDKAIAFAKALHSESPEGFWEKRATKAWKDEGRGYYDRAKRKLGES